VLAGDSVARLAVAYGWQGVFVSLAAVSAVAAVCAAVLHGLNTRAAQTRAMPTTAAAETTRG
jgi:sugar phosphate permease